VTVSVCRRSQKVLSKKGDARNKGGELTKQCPIGGDPTERVLRHLDIQ
jgi:hypothetical protein